MSLVLIICDRYAETHPSCCYHRFFLYIYLGIVYINFQKKKKTNSGELGAVHSHVLVSTLPNNYKALFLGNSEIDDNK